MDVSAPKQKEVKPFEISLEMVKSAAEKCFQVSENNERLCADERVFSRWATWLIMRRVCLFTLPTLADKYCTSPTNVKHGISRAETKIKTDEKFRFLFSEIGRTINAGRSIQKLIKEIQKNG